MTSLVIKGISPFNPSVMKSPESSKSSPLKASSVASKNAKHHYPSSAVGRDHRQKLRRCSAKRHLPRMSPNCKEHLFVITSQEKRKDSSRPSETSKTFTPPVEPVSTATSPGSSTSSTSSNSNTLPSSPVLRHDLFLKTTSPSARKEGVRKSTAAASASTPQLTSSSPLEELPAEIKMAIKIPPRTAPKPKNKLPSRIPPLQLENSSTATTKTTTTPPRKRIRRVPAKFKSPEPSKTKPKRTVTRTVVKSTKSAGKSNQVKAAESMLEPVQQPPKEQVDKTKGAVIIDGTTYVAGKPVIHHGQPWEIYPRESDVILGRGNGVAQHAGNVQFRRYCWALRGKYNRAYRTEKRDCAYEVYELVREQTPPGRFIHYVRPGNGREGKWVEAPENRVIEKICQALREKKWTDYSTKPAPDKPREIVWKPSKARASTPRVGPPIHELMAIPGGSFSSELGKKKTTTFTPAMASAAAAAAAAATTPASASKIPASKTTIKSDLSKSAAQTAWNKSEAFKSDFFKNKTTAHSMEVAAKEISKPKEMPRSKLPETQRHRPVLETPPETNNNTALVPTKPVILEAGTRISVFWPLDNAWYDATVKTCSVNSHYLEYDDDGEMEWLDLSKNNFKIRTEDE